MHEVTLILNGVPDASFPQSKEMGLRELGERLSRLKELYRGGDCTEYWEAARLLEDELEPFGLCFQWDDTEEAFCVYNCSDMKD